MSNRISPAVYLALTVALFMGSASVFGQDETAPVRTIIVNEQPIREEITVPGNVISLRDAQLGNAVAGIVAEIIAETGQQVRQGDVLAKLDTALIDAQLSAAEAEAKQQQTLRDDAKADYEEIAQLLKNNNVSRREARQAEAEFEQIDAAFQAAQANANELRQQQRRHQIRAPFDGLVTSRSIDLGEWVNPGDPAFALVALDSLRVDVQLAQQYAPKLDRIDRVTVLDPIHQRELPATVDTVVTSTDINSRTFLARLMIDESELTGTPILNGTAVEVTFEFELAETGLVIPRDAILRRPDGRTSVWVVESSNSQPQVTEQRVELGTDFAGEVHVISGLNANDQVVVRGNESLRDKQQVRITNNKRSE